ncbi:hypothetical protein AX774_g1068 [Zancudomyces culisetae]|uniref:Mediator of RNA polymerase II transcription subunit 1 n=1 Tax=Zancudomyces culisetae TaxID=1213189 RepID=A0A1R1PWL1_ZANCU|nr:hypothetical protein AX774_g1068 [Zancudomyces culisetae]|eukprot:OMH85386.1 hypothetical protein AX774_g1068 [Zancudomyces culisetae]
MLEQLGQQEQVPDVRGKEIDDLQEKIKARLKENEDDKLNLWIEYLKHLSETLGLSYYLDDLTRKDEDRVTVTICGKIFVFDSTNKSEVLCSPRRTKRKIPNDGSVYFDGYGIATTRPANCVRPGATMLVQMMPIVWQAIPETEFEDLCAGSLSEHWSYRFSQLIWYVWEGRLDVSSKLDSDKMEVDEIPDLSTKETDGVTQDASGGNTNAVETGVEAKVEEGAEDTVGTNSEMKDSVYTEMATGTGVETDTDTQVDLGNSQINSTDMNVDDNEKIKQEEEQVQVQSMEIAPESAPEIDSITEDDMKKEKEKEKEKKSSLLTFDNVALVAKLIPKLWCCEKTITELNSAMRHTLSSSSSSSSSSGGSDVDVDVDLDKYEFGNRISDYTLEKLVLTDSVIPLHFDTESLGCIKHLPQTNTDLEVRCRNPSLKPYLVERIPLNDINQTRLFVPVSPITKIFTKILRRQFVFNSLLTSCYVPIESLSGSPTRYLVDIETFQDSPFTLDTKVSLISSTQGCVLVEHLSFSVELNGIISASVRYTSKDFAEKEQQNSLVSLLSGLANQSKDLSVVLARWLS